MLCLVALALLTASSLVLVTLLVLVGWLYPVFGPSRSSRFRLGLRRAGRPAVIAIGGIVAGLFLFSLGDCFA